MTFKEFTAWCSVRATDGCWGLFEAICCRDVANKIYKQPFWKREKMWRTQYKNDIMPIVEEIDNEIKESLKNN